MYLSVISVNSWIQKQSKNSFLDLQQNVKGHCIQQQIYENTIQPTSKISLKKNTHEKFNYFPRVDFKQPWLT